MFPVSSRHSYQQSFSCSPSEPGRIPVAGGHDAERPVQGAARAEAGGASCGDGLHPHRTQQELDRPHARL